MRTRDMSEDDVTPLTEPVWMNPWVEGYEAGLLDTVCANPYENPESHDAWEEGYNCGMEDSEK